MAVRTVLAFLFLSWPPWAQALDLFQFIDNVLMGPGQSSPALVESSQKFGPALVGPSQSSSEVGQNLKSEEDDWSNSIVIDLNPKSNSGSQPNQQVPPTPVAPSVDASRSAGSSKNSVHVQSNQAATKAQPSGPRYEIKKPEVYKEVLKEKQERPTGRWFWKDDKKAHWEFQLRQYYDKYIGNERHMDPKERATKLQENAQFYDPYKARSLDPNKYVLPLNGVSGVKTVSQFVTRRSNTYELILFPIPTTISKNMSPQGQLDATAWNNAFSSIAGGSDVGIIRQYNSDAELNAGIEALCQQAGVQNCNAEFKDALKSSAGKWEANSRSEVVEEKYYVKNKTKIKWRLEPLIYFNLDFEKKITNLTPYNPGSNEPPIPSPSPSPDDSPVPRPDLKMNFMSGKILLQPALSSTHGYEVNQSRIFGIGGGVGLQSVIDWSQSHWSFLMQFGVAAGAMATITEVQALNRIVDDPYQRQDNDIYENPTAENLKAWKIGESYKYGLRGGFMATAGVHWFAIFAGPTLVKEGSAEHVVTKIGVDRVMVEVTKLDVFSIAGTLGLPVASYSEVIKNNIQKVKKTYFYDLSMEAGQRAFEQLMIGNYYDTQVLISEGKTVAVALVERDTSLVYLDSSAGDFISSWYLGIPFFYWNWLKGKTTEEGYLERFADEIETRYFHGLYFDNFHRRLAFDHQYVTSGFYTGIENSSQSPMIYATSQDYYGRYFWNFQDESARKSTLREQLNEMIFFKTGLEELDVNEINVPKDLGYTNAEVIMDLDKFATDALMGVGEGGGSDLFAAMNRAIDHFAKTDYPMDLDYCNSSEMNAYRLQVNNRYGPEPDKSAAKADCVKKIRQKTSSIVNQMIEKLKIMSRKSKAKDDKSKKEFAQAYREFGRLMMTDRFTFRTVYNALSDFGVGDFVRYTINGEKLANMVIYFPSGRIDQPLTSATR